MRNRAPVVFHNRAPWWLVRRFVVVVDFGDGTYAVGWRWSRRMWECA